MSPTRFCAAAARTEARHRLSLEAIDSFLSHVGEERLTNVPEMERVRRDLLEDALGFYRRLLAESTGPDPALRLEVGLALTRMGEIQRLLGHLDESAAPTARHSPCSDGSRTRTPSFRSTAAGWPMPTSGPA